MYSMFKMIFGVWMIRYLYSPISLHDVQHSIFCVKCFVLQTGKFTIFNRCLGSVSEPNGSVTVPLFFLYFLASGGGFPLYPAIYSTVLLHNDPAAPQDQWGRCRIRTRDFCLRSLARYQWATTSHWPNTCHSVLYGSETGHGNLGW